MAGRGREIERQLQMPTTSALAGAALVQATLRTLPDTVTATLRPGLFETSRTYRPIWSVVLAVVLAPLLGLGLLLLLVKRSETCRFQVSEQRGRTELRISGRLPRRNLERVMRTLDAESAVDDREAGSATRAARSRRNARPDTHGSLGAGAEALVLRFDDGKTFPVSSVGVVGRDPSPVNPADNPVLITVVGDTKSVSKSHFAFGVHPQGVWIEDLRSTNGTYLAGPSGERLQIAPGQRVPLAPGSLVYFGDRAVRVESS